MSQTRERRLTTRPLKAKAICKLMLLASLPLVLFLCVALAGAGYFGSDSVRLDGAVIYDTEAFLSGPMLLVLGCTIFVAVSGSLVFLGMRVAAMLRSTAYGLLRST